MPIAPTRTLAVQRSPLKILDYLWGSPVLFLPCQEGAGDYACDISGYGNNGHLGGGVEANKPAWTQLPSGLWVLHFDGTDDYVDCGNAVSLQTDDVTASFWINPDVLPWANWLRAMCKTANWVDGWEFLCKAATKTIYAVFYGSATTEKIESGDLTQGQWVKLTLVYKDSITECKFYVNAGLIDTKTFEMVKPTTNPLVIGALSDYTMPFDGLIALPRIYNSALSALEIQNLFNLEKPWFDTYNGKIPMRLLKQRELGILR